MKAITFTVEKTTVRLDQIVYFTHDESTVWDDAEKRSVPCYRIRFYLQGIGECFTFSFINKDCFTEVYNAMVTNINEIVNEQWK